MKKVLFFTIVLFGVIYIKNKEIDGIIEYYSVDNEE